MRTLTRVSLLVVAALSLSGCSSDPDQPAPSFSNESDRIEAFCGLVSQGRDLETASNLTELTVDLEDAVQAATTDDDPVAIAAIRAWGTALVESSKDLVPVYEELLTVTDDPVLRRAIEMSIELNGDAMKDVGADLILVDSVAQFGTVMADFSTMVVSAMSDPADQEAILALNEYSIDSCGFPLSTTNG